MKWWFDQACAALRASAGPLLPEPAWRLTLRSTSALASQDPLSRMRNHVTSRSSSCPEVDDAGLGEQKNPELNDRRSIPHCRPTPALCRCATSDWHGCLDAP